MQRYGGERRGRDNNAAVDQRLRAISCTTALTPL